MARPTSPIVRLFLFTVPFLFVFEFPLLLSAQEFRIDRFFVIGDSLSDAGAYPQAVVAGSGGALPVEPRYRFLTNNLDGSSLVWAEHLANTLGIPSGPDVLQGVPVAGIPTVDLNGGNYAEGGSRVSQQPGVIGGGTPAQGFTTLPGTEQVDRLLADSPTLTQNDLVAVWLGANDVFTQFAAIGGGLSVSAANANMQTAADELVGQVNRLADAGAENILVVLVPDIGAVPFGQSQGTTGSALLTQLSTTFNDRLAQGLRGTNAVIVDSVKLLAAIQADPARYGFDSPNANVPACTGSSLTCIQGQNAASDSEERIFADSVHPTASAHQLFGQAGFAGLQAASQAGTVPFAVLTALRQQAISLENRLTPVAFAQAPDCCGNKRRQIGDVDEFFSTEFGFYDAGAEQVRPGLNAETQVVKMGKDVMIAENALIGGGLSFDHGQLNFEDGLGGFDSRLIIGVLYSTVALSKTTYLNAASAVGHINLYNVERSFFLGPSQESYTGNTDGLYHMARVGGGFLAKKNSWIINPAVSLVYEPVVIDGYTETLGAASVAYGDIEIEPLRINGSITVSHVPEHNPLAWRTIFRASLEEDLQDDDLYIPLGPNADTLGLVSAPRPDGKFGFLSAQFVKPLNGQSAFSLSGSSVVGLNDSTGWTVSMTYKLNH